MRVRRAVYSLLFVVGCGDDVHPFNPSTPDAAAVKVMGCDDPLLWTAPALEAAALYIDGKGGSCGAIQYPLHRTRLFWYVDRGFSLEELSHLDRTCWRVVDATPSSGWSAGDRFETLYDDEDWITMAGFGSSVTLEGRVLRDDHTLAFAMPPGTGGLDPAHVLAPDANSIVAVVTPEMWVERDAVHWGSERIATDDVIDASAMKGAFTPFTLHRIGTDIVWRSWWYKFNNGALTLDVPLGPGTRARLAPGSQAIVIDQELVILEFDDNTPSVRHRIPLAAEPTEITGGPTGVTLHIGNELVRYDYTTGAAISRTVADGVLVGMYEQGLIIEDPIYYVADSRFHRLDVETLAFDENTSFSLSADVLATIGTPRVVLREIVLGETGLAIAIDAQTPIPGARAASFTQLFGGAHLGVVGARGTAYSVVRNDGTSTLYEAPYAGACPI